MPVFLSCVPVWVKADFFRNSGMKYQKKITYLGILCKNFHVFYTNLKEIHAF